MASRKKAPSRKKATKAAAPAPAPEATPASAPSSDPAPDPRLPKRRPRRRQPKTTRPAPAPTYLTVIANIGEQQVSSIAYAVDLTALQQRRLVEHIIETMQPDIVKQITKAAQAAS